MRDSDKVKQLIQRALPFNERYIYLSITRGSIESGQTFSCENCGKLITNMVTVVRMSDKRKFLIGTDCAETLSSAKCLYNNGSATDFYLDIYSYNKVARVVTELNKGADLELNGIFARVKKSNGKYIDCSIMDLKKFYPDYCKEQGV